MRTSETIIHFTEALLAAQKLIKFAPKDATNSFHHSKYADLPAVIDAIKEPLNKSGIVFIQTASPSDPGTLALTTRLIHISGEWIEDMAVVPLPKSDPQGFGSAMTYARRYTLAALTGLYQDDDDGNAASLAPSKPPVSMPRAVPPQVPPASQAGPAPVEAEGPPPPWVTEQEPAAPVHPNVQKVQATFGGRVLGNPDKPISEKQTAFLRTLRGRKKIADSEYHAFLEQKIGKPRTEQLTNGDVNRVIDWINSHR